MLGAGQAQLAAEAPAPVSITLSPADIVLIVQQVLLSQQRQGQQEMASAQPLSSAPSTPQRAPQGYTGPPPPLPPTQLPPSAPASHLAAFPPALPGSSPMQLINNDAAGQPLVSGQLTHITGATQVDSVASFAAGSTPTINFNHYGSGAAMLDQATSNLLAHLPRGIRPQKPATRDAVPKSAADFADSLWYWLETDLSIRTLPEVYDAWQRYVRLTAQYADEHGLAGARAYHAECMEAAERGWWHLRSSGPCYTQALSTFCLLPSLLAGGVARRHRPARPTSQRPAAAKRKTAAPAQEEPAARIANRQMCSVHEGSNHTDAACIAQQAARQSCRPREAAGEPGRQAATRR